ncbi:unnamed protein product [Scytosiphon promiscuus]
MRFGVDTIVVEAVKGNPPSSGAALFRIEAGGFLLIVADGQGPLPKDGTQEDYHAVIRAEPGGEVELSGEVVYTASSVAVNVGPMPKETEWHRQQQQQQQQQRHQQRGNEPAASTAVPPRMPWMYRSYSSGFQERVLQTAKDNIKVGEELRFPSQLVAVDGGAAISLGVDGRVMHSPEARSKWIREKIEEATIITTAETYKGTLTRRRVDRAELSLLLADVDEDDQRTVKTLFTPSAEASVALLRGFAKEMKELERAGEGGGRGPDSASAGAVMKEDTSRREPSPTVPDGVPGTEAGTDGKPNQEADEGLPLPSPREYETDVVARVTNTGSLIVTVGERTMLEAVNPSITKRQRGLVGRLATFYPFAKLRDFFYFLRRQVWGHRHQKETTTSYDITTSSSNKGVDGDGAAIVSDGYSLHAVKNGLEVRLDGELVWGRYA